MKTPAYRPGGSRYLVLPDEVQTKTETIGEYVIEDRKDPHKQASSGTVAAKGKGCTEYELGDWVSYGQYSGYDQEVDGVKYKVLAEAEILGQKLRTPFDGKCIGCGRDLPTGLNCCIECNPEWQRLTITEADPAPAAEVPVPVAAIPVCDYCFSTKAEHYNWCVTLKVPTPDPAPAAETSTADDGGMPF